jgi:hypothetical protein
MRQDDVRGEQRRIGKREGHAERLTDEACVRQEVDARAGRDDRREVARHPGADGSEDDGPDELDRGHGRQWQAVDGDVEADVHHGEHGAQSDDQRLTAAVEREKAAPWPAPGGKDERCRRDAQPRHAEHVDTGEEEDRERRPEVMEDGAPHEVDVGRHRGWSVAGDDVGHGHGHPATVPRSRPD